MINNCAGICVLLCFITYIQWLSTVLAPVLFFIPTRHSWVGLEEGIIRVSRQVAFCLAMIAEATFLHLEGATLQSLYTAKRNKFEAIRGKGAYISATIFTKGIHIFMKLQAWKDCFDCPVCKDTFDYVIVDGCSASFFNQRIGGKLHFAWRQKFTAKNQPLHYRLAPFPKDNRSLLRYSWRVKIISATKHSRKDRLKDKNATSGNNDTGDNSDVTEAHVQAIDSGNLDHAGIDNSNNDNGSDSKGENNDDSGDGSDSNNDDTDTDDNDNKEGSENDRKNNVFDIEDEEFHESKYDWTRELIDGT